MHVYFVLDLYLSIFYCSQIVMENYRQYVVHKRNLYVFSHSFRPNCKLKKEVTKRDCLFCIAVDNQNLTNAAYLGYIN